MENKYYTPESSEFFIGFEYEFKSEKSYGYHDKIDCPDWTQYEFHASSGAEDEASEFECISQALNGDVGYAVRVKCLDVEDFKGFGFNITALGRSGNSTSLMDTWIFNQKIKYRGNGYECCLLYNNISKWLLITISNKTNENTLFCGFVKNKSELKKLLKQLNIS